MTPNQGQLKQVRLGELPLPVIIVLDERELQKRGGTGAALRPEEFQTLIQQGLRAQLAMESLLTGLLYIDLGFHPKSPAQLLIVPGSGPYTEIPTIPTDLEQIKENATRALAKLEKIDFNGLITSTPTLATRSTSWRKTLISIRRSRSIDSSEVTALRVWG